MPPPRFSTATSPQVRTKSVSRCFRTDSAGRIPLINDWRRLFQTVSHIETIAIQSRHAYARLIALDRMPALTWWEEEGLRAIDDAGTLQLRCSGWGQAWGRIAVCPCCDSPGTIEIHNALGSEFLQLCAFPGSDPANWAGYLDRLATDSFTVNRPSTRALTGLSLLPEGTHRVAVTGAILPVFFSAISTQSVRVQVLLTTPELTHMREFTPRYVSTENLLLTVNDLRVTVQIALPQVRAVTVADNLSLHVTGADNTLLASFAPAGPEHSTLWRITLKNLFPNLPFNPTKP